MLPSMRLLFLHCILEQETAKDAGSQYKLHHITHTHTHTHTPQVKKKMQSETILMISHINLRQGERERVLDILTCGSQARSCIAHSVLQLERNYRLARSIRNPKRALGSWKHKLREMVEKKDTQPNIKPSVHCLVPTKKQTFWQLKLIQCHNKNQTPQSYTNSPNLAT